MEPIVQAAAQAVAQPAAVNPLALAAMAGPVLAHVVQPIAAKIPAPIRAAAVGAIAVISGAAAVSAQSGVPFRAALSHGLVTAFAAKAWHLGLLKPEGLLVTVARALAGTKNEVKIG